MARRIQQQPLFVLIVAVVFVCSLWIVFARQPEQIVAVSGDGVLKVEGVAREVRGVTLEVLDRSTSQYAVSVDGQRMLENVTISFPSKEVFPKGIQLLVFDRSTNAWIQEPCSYDKESEQYSVHLDKLGSTVIRIGYPVLDVSVDKENLLY